MLDTFVYGESTRKSPEADVPVLIEKEKRYVPGGAANVAANIIGLGANCQLVSICGADHTAEFLFTELEKISCSTSHLIQIKERKTTNKTRYFHNRDMLMRLDVEEINYLNDIEIELLFKTVKDLLNSANRPNGIIIQDYNKGVCHAELNKKIIGYANSLNIPVFVDPKLSHYDSFSGCQFFKPNLKELSYFLQSEMIDDNVKSLNEAISKLNKHIEADNYIITLGSKGAYFSNSAQNGLISTHPIEQADVCGAGDSFISALALSVCMDIPLKKSIHFANMISGIACTKLGVQAVSWEEINQCPVSKTI